MIKGSLLCERAVKGEGTVKAILRFAGVDIEAVKKRAKHDGTLAVFEGLIA